MSNSQTAACKDINPSCKACNTPLSSNLSVGKSNGYDLLRCPSCASVTVNPWPTVEQLINFYQSYKGTTDYRKKQDRKIARAKARIRKLMRRTKGRRLLDIGSNYGFTIKAALDLGLDAKGIDIDATAVAASVESFGNHFETVSVQDYAARGEQADIIYTAEVVEHVPDPDSFIAAVAKILAPSGVLYLTTPDAGHFRVPKDFTSWYSVMPPEHITYFTRRGLTRLCNKHGLEIEKFFFSLKPGIRMIARKSK